MKFDTSTMQAESVLQEEGTLPPNADLPDKMQAVFYREGVRLLNVVSSLGLEKTKAFYELDKGLQDLKRFTYNVGFAGEQSCGKSTVINSLIQYPLMPTCRLATTSKVVRLMYGEKIRIIATDDETQKRVLDIDCSAISEEQFRLLKEYAVMANSLMIIETLQYFTSKDLVEEKPTAQDLEMERSDPKHVAALLLILLSVYVGEDFKCNKANRKRVMDQRFKLLRFFGIPEKAVNYSVMVQWNCDLLRSGLLITDLPGLGAVADGGVVNGKQLKGHADITREAIKSVDAMVFLAVGEMHGVALDAIREMLSSTKLKEVVNKGNRIIPVLNKADMIRGERGRSTVLNSYVDILANANVQKKQEDIRLYSAIFGEYAFEGIDFTRTQFYLAQQEEMRNALQMVLGDELSEDDMQEKVINGLKKKLKGKYDTSGIEELKEFFRTICIQRGKYERELSVLSSIRQLISSTLLPARTMAANYQALCNISNEVTIEVSQKLQAEILEMMGTAVRELDYSIEKVVRRMSAAESMVNQAPVYYENAFEVSLQEYKERNKEIADRFELFMYSARIDVVPSSNYDTYQELLKQIKIMSVDLTNVNRQYEKALQFVTDEVDGIYEAALDNLRNFKGKFPERIQQIVSTHKIDENEASIQEPLNMLQNNLIQFLDAQLEEVGQTMKGRRANLTDAGNDAINEIIDLNSKAVKAYTEPIINSMSDLIHGGVVFKSRDYLTIDGDDGLMKKLNELSLSTNDRKTIKSDVEFTGAERINNHLDAWCKEAEDDVKSVYVTMADQMKKLLDNTVGSLSGTADDNKAYYKKVKEQADCLEQAARTFRDQAQPLVDEMIAETNEADWKRYGSNLLAGIVKKEENDEIDG